MVQSGANPDLALSLAQTARRALPDSPGVADTLGMVYYQKGAYANAIDFFQEALKLTMYRQILDGHGLWLLSLLEG